MKYKMASFIEVAIFRRMADRREMSAVYLMHYVHMHGSHAR